MIFGTRCVEESILLPSNHEAIKAFYPVDNDMDDDGSRTPYVLIDYLLEHADTLLSGKRVLEIGATGLSLVVATAACGYCEPATSIMAYSDDAKRLQLLEPAAQTILNPLIQFPTKLQTRVWNDDESCMDALPYEADVVFITLPTTLTEEGMRRFLQQQPKGVTLVHYEQNQQLVVARTTQ